jgi:hypothetical protein
MTVSFANIANSQTGAPDQSPIPATIAKDCAARILKDHPKTKIVGSFARLSPAGPLARWIHEGKVLYIAAPTSGPGFMDRIVRHSHGCKYYIRDGKLEFGELIPQIHLPQRRKLPGEK